jgi:hypothetical protein
MEEHTRRLAQAIRDACIEEALAAYEDGGMRGLCHEGRWEYAIGAIRQLDLERVIERAAGCPSSPPTRR